MLDDKWLEWAFGDPEMPWGRDAIREWNRRHSLLKTFAFDVKWKEAGPIIKQLWEEQQKLKINRKALLMPQVELSVTTPRLRAFERQKGF
jgi:hypothetical protein